jgi:hypothetical protein
VIGPAVTTQRPLGLNCASLTTPKWPRSTSISRPLAASQTRASWSKLAVTTCVPSGLKRADVSASR